MWLFVLAYIVIIALLYSSFYLYKHQGLKRYLWFVFLGLFLLIFLSAFIILMMIEGM